MLRKIATSDNKERKKGNSTKGIFSLTLLILLAVQVCWATLGGELLDSGNYSIGLGRRQFVYVLLPKVIHDVSFEKDSYGYFFGFVTLGLLARMEAEIDFARYNRTSKHSERAYNWWVLGCGVKVRAVAVEHFQTNVTLRWWSRIGFDKSEYHYHKSDYGIDMSISAGLDYDWRKASGFLYGVLFYSDHHFTDYPTADIVQYRENVNNKGFLCGLSLTMFRHVQLRGEIQKAKWFSYAYRIAWIFK